MTVLVIGATGFQGGAVARLLAEQGRTVRGFARTAPAADQAVPGVDVLTGDLGDAEAVRKAFAGVTHASVLIPQVYDPDTVVRFARNVARAARDEGVARLVVNGNTRIPAQTTEFTGFETRRQAERILLDSGVPTTAIRPPVYLDNLYSPIAGPALVNDGVLAFPLPPSVRAAWLSHEDLAKATVAALTTADVAGRTIDLGGAETLTGPELAERFAAVLGREIRYVPLPPERFEAGLAQAFGAETAAGIAGTYRWAATEEGAALLESDPAALESTLGVRPTPVADWIAARDWQVWAR
ncbi:MULTISPECIES: SDR family oxidoreductase [Streptomycetaceae]|uniref:NmrA family protein n=1 Tax=Streptantibioticus cattleyicolor (strain ATCC 35852 / DSM 46488 / JCM 4925 / NBRC 14057 / NRRL 8057) TaxID=1003195 RepID=F8K432_STREN|nr:MULTISPECIES: NmrA family NAD(P)-binding protein [Streptomycetaceae]AEW92570.1 NmrA family protein [Streptantibioticus cattleyicolor NRRL 8057 = DSM 46488]MYS57354.1 NmrA family NAD(P)-binding protein [Streptomyces sp. SID5468]CCB72926.1 NmrA family protein [Streptantibioticus cattleyicolor NRRL 8057 = DSM 46488]